jgi:undecaprenyl-diphosphatase
MDGLARNYLHHAADSSFPSDHTTLFFAFGFSLWIERPAILRRVGEGLLVLACAVGWSRIYLGAHYPLDILGAAVIGFVSAMLFSIRPGRAVRDYATGLGEKLYALPFDLTGFRRR